MPEHFTFIHQELFIPHEILQLPHASSIWEWTSTINCEPGFFYRRFFRPSEISWNYQRLHRFLLLIDGNGNKETNDLW